MQKVFQVSQIISCARVVFFLLGKRLLLEAVFHAEARWKTQLFLFLLSLSPFLFRLSIQKKESTTVVAARKKRLRRQLNTI